MCGTQPLNSDLDLVCVDRKFIKGHSQGKDDFITKDHWLIKR